jgi:unsaturated rhamnogalacturonyl hydrolase
VLRALSSTLGLVAVACAAQPAPLNTPERAAAAAPTLEAGPPASAANPLPSTPDSVQILLENPLAEPRLETISLKLLELSRIVPTLEAARLVVVDAAQRPVSSQLIDSNADDVPDEIVFQTRLLPNDTQRFRVQPGERQPFRPADFKVYGRFVRERHDDFAFESDRVAHRMYGQDLETWKKEPLTSSGVDVWAKRTRRLVINDWYLSDDYHRDHGEGADLYSVKAARGCGGLGVWNAGKLAVSRNFKHSRVLTNGPIRLIFELEYPAYDSGAGQVTETKRITVDAGRNLNRFESHFKVDSGTRPATVGIGIAKHAGGKAAFEKELGLLHSWEPFKEDNGSFGCGIVASPETVDGVRETELDTLLIANVPPTGPQVYYAGFGWDKSGDFADQPAWLDYARSFARALRAPLRISLSSAAERSAAQPEPGKSWARRTCDWFLERRPDGLGETWEYDNGLILRGCEQLWQKTRDERYFGYLKKSLDRLISQDGSIQGYKLEDYNLDNINSGKLLFTLLARAADAKERERYTKALALLRSQLKTQPRTTDGGFWHKKVYPSQMWLDGLYMAAPFMAQYGVTFNEPALQDEAVKQLLLMERHARDPRTGLLYHGWDESKKQRWANQSTGLSPEFWGRSLGWYAMALVDTLEQLPEKHPKRGEVVAVLERLATALVAVQDRERGVWWQVLDKPGAPRNYREASATAMFAYALSKGTRKGWLDAAKFAAQAQRAFSGLVSEFASTDRQGNVELRGVCKVAGLGGNPYRDGSYAYYVSTDIASNDPKGLGAFILASVERE